MPYFKKKDNSVHWFDDADVKKWADLSVYTAITDEEAADILAPAPPQPALEEAKTAKITLIDAETSAAILAGFDYEISGVLLHFSYDGNDQQNFSDTANAATLAMMGVPGVPTGVTWNGWKLEKDKEGKVISRALTRLDLTPESFLSLYMAGALAHKAARMEIGGQRKAAVEAAQSIEEVAAA